MGSTLLARAPGETSSPPPKNMVDLSNVLLKEGRLLVTPLLAKRIMLDYWFVGQRQIQKFHVERLAYEMRAGIWTAGTQLAFALLPDGRLFLINGCHRLLSVEKTGIPIEFMILIVPCRDMDEVRAQYLRFDTVQATRTPRQIIASLALAEKLGISSDTLAGAYQAGVVIENGLKFMAGSSGPTRHTIPYGKIDAVAPYWSEVKVYDGIIRSCLKGTQRRMRLPSIMAVALVTLKHQPEKAFDFWVGAAEDDALPKGDPRKVLIRLMGEKVRTDRLGQLMIYTANCWNAYYRGETLDSTKAHKTSECRPLGTPFSGLRRDRAGTQSPGLHV